MISFLLLVGLTSVLVSGQVARPPYSGYYDPRQYNRPYDPRYDVAPVAPVAPYNRHDYRNVLHDESYKPYSFSYSAPADNGVGQSSRTESADGSGRVEGSYTLTNEEGHTRVVDYVADQDGFRATIQTNEPGTESKNPASVTMNSAAVPYVGPYAPYAPRPYAPRPYGARPYAPRPFEYPQPVAPVLNTAAEEPAAEQPVDAGVYTPPVRPLYRRPSVYANRNYYQGNRRELLQPYRNPYNVPY